MGDLEEQPGGDSSLKGDAASAEIARSLGSVWQRFSGQRPKSTSVEISKDAVSCVIEEGAADQGSPAEGDASEDERLSAAGLKHNSIAVITRITGRRVVAFIPKRDKKTEICTQKFLLDQPRQRF
jgi:hypothetical protein